MNDAISQLCPNCGLCCDSTLFADVELRKGDDAKALTQAGLKLFQKKKATVAFSQPCACFVGRRCAIYQDRPKHCRLFECRLLKKVAAAELPAAVALKKIAETRKLAEKIRRLLRECGQRDETMALTHRYAAAMNAPIDLADEGAADRRGELMLAVGDLMQILERDFL
ncbi:MAG TPA: YkgJ family cysteine cluster protein [Verrucomicrobiae bacterium]